VWDQIGERIYQTGLDRGVLYLDDGTAVPWNGLTSVEEESNSEIKEFYLNGVKFLQNAIPSDFSAKLKAFTYPEEFEAVNGVVEVEPGMFYHDQPLKSFNLSYRTKIGNDIDGIEHGYKIHLLYNLLANPDNYSFETIGKDAQPSEFSWALTGTPPAATGYRPTVHISIDSRKADPATLQLLEGILYGSDTSDPRFPTLDEVSGFFGSLGSLVIVDNGDGTWTAIDSSNDYITMLDDTTFQIDNADAEYIDATTYQITTTNP